MSTPAAEPSDPPPLPPRGRMRRLVAPLAGASIGFAWFSTVVGAFTLDPTDLSWIYGDHAQHLFGWLLFRNEPWRLPLGTIQSLAYPVGTTVGFTDANPWLSVLLKPASRWLPQDFQFIGPWLAACLVLQGVFGARIMQTLTASVWQQVCGAALFVLAPPLHVRIGHDTLSAHWLLLALIWLHLRPNRQSAGTIAWAYGVCGIAAGVHPYLAAMVVTLSLALCVRLYLQRAIDRMTAIIASTGLIVETAAVFTLFGYFSPTMELGIAGFGIYSADLLTFFNAVDVSRWVPGLPMGEGQYEGFGYLGLGVLALAAGAIAVSLRRRRPIAIAPHAWPLVVAGTLLGIFALSNHVTVAGHEVLTMRGFYGMFGDALGPLRASGRFIWPLHYILLTGILALVARKHLGSRTLTNLSLAAAVAIQFVEVWPITPMVPGDPPRLRSEAWHGLGASYRHLALYPPYFADRPTACQETSFDYEDAIKFMALAYRERMTTNSAYLARGAMRALGAACEQLRREIANGHVRPDTVYIVSPEKLAQFARPEVNAVCGRLDNLDVCVHGESSEPFREILDATRIRER